MTKTEIHESFCSGLHALYCRKNHDYGDSFAANFAEYGMIYPIIHMSEKLNRVKVLSQKNPLVAGESLEDSLRDLANYAMMTLTEIQYNKRDCTSCAHVETDEHNQPCVSCTKSVTGVRSNWEGKA